MAEKAIKDFYGRIIGFIDENPITGNKTAKNFYRQIVGTYDKRLDVTKDFYGRIVSRGDTVVALIYQDTASNKK